VLSSVPEPNMPAPAKPKAGVVRSERSAAEALKNAAVIETIEDGPSVPFKGAPRHASAAETVQSHEPSLDPSSDSSPVPGSNPMTVTTESSAEGPPANNDQLAALTKASDTLPLQGAPVSQGITPGKLIHKVEPIYPLQARMQGISGTVRVEVTIAEDGSVSDVKQTRGNPLLAVAASYAIRQWRYTPFLLNGKPQTVQKGISVMFKLPNK
jgi:TonB family protein